MIFFFFLQNLKKVSTKSLHQILPHVKQTFHKLHQQEKAGVRLGNQTQTLPPPPPPLIIAVITLLSHWHIHFLLEKLLEIIHGSSDDVFMVFCNTVPSCDWTAHYLRSNGVELTKLHAGFSSMVRQHIDRTKDTSLVSLPSFPSLQDRRNLLKEFASGSTRVLVCTDIASRGIDAKKVGEKYTTFSC